MTVSSGRVGVLIAAAVALAAALALAFAAPPSAEAAYWKKCGDQNRSGAGWYDAKGHNVTCKTARRVARHYTYKGEEPRGWDCKDRMAGYELAKAKCVRERDGELKVVKFKIGA